MSNKLIPFDWVKFQEGYKVSYNDSHEIERHKFLDGSYGLLFSGGALQLLRSVGTPVCFSLIVPTVYRYRNLYAEGGTGKFHDTIKSMKEAAEGIDVYHSYLRGEFDGEELINVEIVKR